MSARISNAVRLASTLRRLPAMIIRNRCQYRLVLDRTDDYRARAAYCRGVGSKQEAFVEFFAETYLECVLMLDEFINGYDN